MCGTEHTFILKQDIFHQYFLKLAKNPCHDIKFVFPETVARDAAIAIGNMVETREGTALALQILKSDFVKRSVRRTGGYRETIQEPGPIRGRMFLLPEIAYVNNAENIAILLEDLTGVPQGSLSPGWAKEIKFEKLARVEKKLFEINKNVSALKEAYFAAEKEYQALDSYKKLVYASGKELELVFKRTLEDLGCHISDSKYSEEEYILNWEGKEYLIEAKGNTKSISLGDLRQLLDYLLKCESDTGKASRGILFGNAWRELPLAERCTKEKPYFPNNVIKRAEVSNVALLSSQVFFNAFVLFLEGKYDPEKMMKLITTTNGVVVL